MITTELRFKIYQRVGKNMLGYGNLYFFIHVVFINHVYYVWGVYFFYIGIT